MIELLLGGHVAEKTLFYLQEQEAGHAGEIARLFNLSASQVTKQLIKFADAGLLVSHEVGRARVYQWNSRNPLVDALRRFLSEAIEMLPVAERERYRMQRGRPRSRHKPVEHLS